MEANGRWAGRLLVDHTVKWSFGVNTKSIVPSTVQRACRLAMAGPRGPVFVSMPMEYMFDTMTKDVPSDLGSAPLATADPKGIEDLANLLAGAQNPVIVAEDAGKTMKSVNCWSRSPSCSAARWSRPAAPASSTFRAPILCTVAMTSRKSPRAPM
jgi:hypothetical protein